MDEESSDTAGPTYSLYTAEGQKNTSRGYTGKGVATYYLNPENQLNIEKFDGIFNNGIREGFGKYTYKDGSTYEGGFDFNKKSGLGLATYLYGNNEDEEDMDEDEHTEITERKSGKYLGNFVDGKRHSDGSFLYPNGDIYTGEWFAGKKHGIGVYRFKSDGSSLIGKWVLGTFTHGRWVLPSGISYSGFFKGNKPTGKGLWNLPYGNCVSVEYMNYAPPDNVLGSTTQQTDSGDGAEEVVAPATMKCLSCYSTRV